MFLPRSHANCATQAVIYLMTCQRNAFYVGKIICQLWQCINDHLHYSGNGKILTPVCCHIGLQHRTDMSVVSFIVLEVVTRDPCGGNWDKKILQQENCGLRDLMPQFHQDLMK